ncbi:MAG: single-stranded-DNA-specific exonuclease RecJ, partial [Methylophilaceae bacterium]|nr:single-stranded-DNA-specific exonuclease RecJ [Methylophilaceae bacterium]
MANIVLRSFNQDAAATLSKEGVMPILARVLSARGIHQAAQLDVSLAKLIPPEQLTNASEMAVLLADAIAQNQSL